MADESKKDAARTRQPNGATRKGDAAPAEGEAAVEWGDRLDTGKTIARGGKEEGDVAGATEQTPAKGE